MKECVECGSNTTPQWRLHGDRVKCNACALRIKRRDIQFKKKIKHFDIKVFLAAFALVQMMKIPIPT